LVNLLYCEFLKLKRSNMLLISLLGALVAPALMFANGVRSHYTRPDLITVMGDFYDSCTTYSMLMFGLIVYAVITAYLFSREYIEDTLKTILTVPIQKLTFITSKFILLFVWILFLTLISWISIYVFSAIYNAMFGLVEFGIAVAIKYLFKMILGGILMFLTITPIAFLSIWTKGFVAPLIVAATIAMGNVLIYSESLGALFPWAASYLLISGGMVRTGYPNMLAIILIAFVSLFGFLASAVYFNYEDIK